MVLPARSLLFVPANRPDRYAKAAAAGADKVIIDLEDSVPADQRAAAREMIAPALPEVPRERLLVRVNPTADPDHAADLDAVPLAAVGGLMVPKLEHAAELRGLAGELERREAAAGLAVGSTFLVVLIETARGVRDADALLEAAAGLGRGARRRGAGRPHDRHAGSTAGAAHAHPGASPAPGPLRRQCVSALSPRRLPDAAVVVRDPGVVGHQCHVVPVMKDSTWSIQPFSARYLAGSADRMRCSDWTYIDGTSSARQFSTSARAPSGVVSR